ncbi:aldehyde dehydrogenase family protein [Amycolatopsis jejuensis]|uniref:aldehyde dehydrogenase family protein n=1 Tax=Amycolatopsis jejuensis TaxID=330084 RepID=UPI000525E052|nr:aldehyde dehydrogenase family protein [Amycolatopsis jejuensis]
MNNRNLAGAVPDVALKPRYLPFVDGKFTASSDEVFPAVNPATGEHLADLTRGNSRDIDAAVAAATAAFPSWAATRVEERCAMLLKLADALEGDAERLALIDSLDIGRRVFETTIDHTIAVGQFRFFAAAAVTHSGWNRSIPGGWALAKREPYGVCGQIIPWNVPAIMTAFKIAPALAAGNTVVLKPDENASLSTMELCAHVAEIFPPGVVNVVPGFGEEAGAALTAHPGVAKLAFTGSSEVGRLVSHAGAERLVPVTLELGGKSPNIVFPDVQDLDALVDNVAFAATYCNGQSCLAGTRLFVHDDVYDRFLGKLVEAFRRMKVGSPLDPATTISCLVSGEQGEKVLGYVDIGRNEGAELLVGGNRVAVPGNEHGWFVEPTLFAVDNQMRIAQEEIFGPVLSVLRWNDFDTMIAEANDVRYGLAAGLYTNDLANAMRAADALQAGSVWVNQYFNMVDGSPFGGHKESGIGSELCAETLNMYTHLKSVTLAAQLPQPFYLPPAA